MATEKNFEFKTSVFTGTQRDVKKSGLSNLLISTLGGAKAVSNTIDYRKKIKEQEEEKLRLAKKEQSVLEASDLANKYYSEYEKQNIASKSEKEKREFIENYKNNIDFSRISDDSIRNRTENEFNKFIISAQGKEQLEYVRQKKINSSMVLNDMNFNVESDIRTWESEGKNPVEIDELFKEKYYVEDFEYNPALLAKDKIKFDKSLSRLTDRINTSIIRYNREKADTLMTDFAYQNTRIADKETFDDSFESLKDIDPNIKKDSYIERHINVGYNEMLSAHKNGQLVGKKYSEARDMFFGDWINEIKNPKHFKKLNRLMAQVNSDYETFKTIEDLGAGYIGEQLDGMVYKKNGKEKEISQSVKKSFANNYISSILGSGLSTEEKGEELGKFYSKNESYAKPYMDTVASKILADGYSVDSEDFKIMNNARANGYIGTKNFNETMDDLYDIAKRYNFDMNNDDWANQAKEVLSNRKLKASEFKKDGNNFSTLKRTISDLVDENVSNQDLVGDGILSSSLNRVFSSPLIYKQNDLYTNQESIKDLAFKYSMELGVENVDDAIALAQKRVKEIYQGTQVPVSLISENKEAKALIEKNKIEPLEIQELIKDEIRNNYVERVGIKEQVSGLNIDILPTDSSNSYSTKYRVFVKKEDGSLLESIIVDNEYLVRASKLGVYKEIQKEKEKQKTRNDIFKFFFPDITSADKESLKNSIANRYGTEDDVLEKAWKELGLIRKPTKEEVKALNYSLGR